MSETVLVTGVGAVTGLGPGWRKTLEGWRAGRIATGPMEPLDLGDLEGLRDPRRKAKGVRLVAAAALDAYRGAGLDPAAPDAVDLHAVASAFGCLEHSRDYQVAVIRRAGASPMLFSESVLNAPAGHLAIERGLHGAGHALSTSLYDGLDALRLGFEAVGSGRARRALVAGYDEWIRELEPVFRSCGFLREGAEPSGCAPFSRRRDGFRLGEAAAAIVLESGAAVEGRGVRALARLTTIVGSYRPDDPEAAVAGAQAAARGLPAPRWIFPSANGGPCDGIEERWLDGLPGTKETPPAFASTKPALGEAFAGSAFLHAVFAALAVAGESPPTLDGRDPPASGRGAWALGSDPVGSLTLAAFEAP